MRCDTYDAAPVSKNLTEKQRQAVKDKFTAVNLAFDLCEKGGQKTWRAPFLETAETLRSAVRDNVCVAYTQFYLRYKDSGFTKKHPEKYIKRSPEEVSLVVEGLFGGRS
jgi:UDP-N-acetyl-D-mannosaminuronic acid transferase (WecB/TagA/CpsF family)|tara:strand:- start:211 stop:537 length:327 start_codon:yes stop_codon:yes gene_type:complete